MKDPLHEQLPPNTWWHLLRLYPMTFGLRTMLLCVTMHQTIGRAVAIALLLFVAEAVAQFALDQTWRRFDRARRAAAQSGLLDKLAETLSEEAMRRQLDETGGASTKGEPAAAPLRCYATHPTTGHQCDRTLGHPEEHVSGAVRGAWSREPAS